MDLEKIRGFGVGIDAVMSVDLIPENAIAGDDTARSISILAVSLAIFY